MVVDGASGVSSKHDWHIVGEKNDAGDTSANSCVLDALLSLAFGLANVEGEEEGFGPGLTCFLLLAD